MWWKLIDLELKELDFISCNKDVCVRTQHTKGYLFLLAIYIDDLVIASKSTKQIVKLKGHLWKRFSMKPIGYLDYVCVHKVKRDMEHKKLKLNQETYAKRILEWFGMTNCCLTTCSVTTSATLEAHEGIATNFLYFQVVGSMMYLTMGTRPDRAFNVGLILRFASNPYEVHVKVVKRILSYLVIKLTFGRSNNQQLVGYTDADYVGCTSTRRSTFGHVFLYRRVELGWGSKK